MATDTFVPSHPPMPPTSQPPRKPDDEDDESRFYNRVTFASDNYVPWIMGSLRLANADTSRLTTSGVPVLRSHEPDNLVGAVTRVEKVAGLWRSDWRLPKIAGNRRTFDQMDAGILRGISVGGNIIWNTLTIDNEGEADWGDPDSLRFSADWQLVEESLTAIPADFRAGIDRSMVAVLERDSGIFDSIITESGILTKETPAIIQRLQTLVNSHNQNAAIRRQTMVTPTISPEAIDKVISDHLERSEALKSLTAIPGQLTKLAETVDAETKANMEYRSKLDKLQFQPGGQVLQLSTWSPRDNAIDLGKILRLTMSDDIGQPPLDRTNTSLEESMLEQIGLDAPGRNTVGRLPFASIIEQQKQLMLQRNTLSGGAGSRPVDINVLGDGGLLLSAFSPILGSMQVRSGLSGGQKLPFWTSQGTAAGGAEGSDIPVGVWTLEDGELLPISIASGFEISSSLRAADDGTFESLVRMGIQSVAGEELVAQVLDGAGSSSNEIAGLWGRVSSSSPDRVHEYGAAQSDFSRSDVLSVKNLVALAKTDGSSGAFVLSTTMWQLCESTLRGGVASDMYLLESMGGMQMMDGGMAMMGMMEGRPTYFFQDFAPSGVTDAGLMIKPDRVTVFLWGQSFNLEFVPVMARKDQYKLCVEANIGIIQPDHNLAAIRQT